MKIDNGITDNIHIWQRQCSEYLHWRYRFLQHDWINIVSFNHFNLFRQAILNKNIRKFLWFDPYSITISTGHRSRRGSTLMKRLMPVLHAEVLSCGKKVVYHESGLSLSDTFPCNIIARKMFLECLAFQN